MPPDRADRGVSPDRLTALWAALTAWTPKPGAWKFTPGRRKHLTARIREFDEAAVERVAAWVRTGNHERAAFLRQRGDVDTLLRPENFAKYAAMSEEAPTTGPPAASPGGPSANGPPEEALRAWEWVCGFVRSSVPGMPLAEPATPRQAKARAALRRVPNGWARVQSCNDFNRRALRDEFIERWIELEREAA